MIWLFQEYLQENWKKSFSNAHIYLGFQQYLFAIIVYDINVGGYLCDVTHRSDFSTIASPIKV